MQDGLCRQYTLGGLYSSYMHDTQYTRVPQMGRLFAEVGGGGGGNNKRFIYTIGPTDAQSSL